MMTTLIIILAAFTLIFGYIELFLIPGFGIAGTGSILCALGTIFCVYSTYGPLWAGVAIAVSIALLAASLWWVAHSKTIDRMALHASIDSHNATAEQLSVQVGDTGVALTRLALIGNAQIGNAVVEVKSAGEFINPHTPIRVIEVNQALIKVEALPQT